jgi:trehalose/maltose hydrolase-like predicted phosphorylase
MARWNLVHAAQHAGHLATRAERDGWRALAHALVDGYDAESGLYEQFRGYFALEPLLVRDIADPPVAADVLLGRERIARSQVIKQPDVLMLHQLVPGGVVAGSLRPNLAFYGPRTAHGSSLSPAVLAQLLARDGQPDEALELLRIATSLDLDDRAGTAASGAHVGAAGGAWQAVVFGFLGAEVCDGVLHLDPVLPASWPDLEVRFRCLGHDVRVHVEAAARTVSSSGPLRVAIGPGPVTRIPGRHRVVRFTGTGDEHSEGAT